MTKRGQLHLQQLTARFSHFWHRGKGQKTAIIGLMLVMLAIGTMYGLGEWYIQTEKHKPLELGVSFIPDYAQSLKLDPKTTMDALLNIGVRHFRLVSYWNDIEPSPGNYDFSQLDWQFKKAEARGAKIILTVGLRQPRWPECHAPPWVNLNKAQTTWQPELLNFMKATIERYKNSPSLEAYQLENEYFLKGFGICTNFDRQRLVDEYQLVKSLDQFHPVIIGRSNNAIGLPIGQPQPDEFSISIYKRVWDANFSHRYLEYPFPAWFYGFLAQTQMIVNHRDMLIGEMQAEAWPPNLKSITQASLSEQNKSLNARRLNNRFNYAEATGMRQIYMWGAEYWYYRLVVLHDPSLWNVAQQQFQTANP
ncbi:MAG TPA: beta-galactosidase [Candidatus Dormibacteraeota bacterium]|nr:beta-galactosidase [Candidatus Dormibacteraeota bacterium]